MFVLIIGMFWSSPIGIGDSIVTTASWSPINDGNVTIILPEESRVLVNYKIGIVALNEEFSGTPLPRENLKEYMQVRCVVNDVPLRISGTVASTYFVQKQEVFNLANSFVITLPPGLSTLRLEWKKTRAAPMAFLVIRVFGTPLRTIP